jgi:hyperosmotically inducible periplasmic protein
MQQRLALLLSAAGLVFTAACSQTDAGVTTAVKTKMATDDTVKASEINVDTHNHVVTLNGTVGSQAAKERAVMIARNTKGVTNVVDDLTVGPVPAATAGAYEEKIEDTTHDAKVKTEDAAHDAKVKTEDAAQDAKAKTEQYGHDAKVKTEKAADKAGEVITDSAITTDLKTKYLAEPGVPGVDIHVETNKGVVTLTGNVKTKAEMAKAMSIARGTHGVKRVVNHLKMAA